MSKQPSRRTPHTRALTAKQERFVSEYLVSLNATQAAIRAGYSPKTARSIGHENLTKPAITDAVQAALNRHRDSLDVSLEDIIQEARRVGFSSIQGLFSDGWQLRPPAELSADTAAAVSSARMTTRTLRNGQTFTMTRYRFWPKLKALELLAKLKGFLDPKTHPADAGDSWRDVLLKMDKERELKRLATPRLAAQK